MTPSLTTPTVPALPMSRWRHDGSVGYRPDIDGLRAIAVLLIVAFHAFPTQATGGFIGVDIFFVISGFLITGIILQQLQRGEFLLLSFYARRIRRIFPALIVVLIYCYGFGWVALLPDEFRQLGKHMLAGAAFVINFVFWQEAGYFDTASDIKPLLHLWSLAVEEQFYIAFPMLMLLAHRTHRRPIVIISCLGVASFTAGVVLVSKYPVATFFLPHSRVWELLIGGALAAVGAIALRNEAWSRASSWLREIAAWSGLALIALAAARLSKNTPYPGLAALLPTCGAGLVIGAGYGTWVNRTLLAWRPLVFVGLISFPLYLWHWPLLSFARLLHSGEVVWEIRTVAVVLSLMLASATYWLVERPIRARPLLPTSVGLAALSLAVVGGLGCQVMLSDGFPFRMNIAVNDHATASASDSRIAAHLLTGECGMPEQSYQIGYWCKQDRREDPAFALIGDSHAISFYHGLVAASLPGQRWRLIARPGCSFLSGGISALGNDGCRKLSPIALDALARDPKIVAVLYILATRELLETYVGTAPEDISTPSGQLYLAGLSRSFTMLETAGKQIFMLIDNPSIVYDPKPCLMARPLSLWLEKAGGERCSITLAEHDNYLASFRRLLEKLQEMHPSMIVFDPTHLYCDRERCRVVQDGKSLYSQTDHLSDFASLKVATEFLQVLATTYKRAGSKSPLR
jgi:peptidoglycan/LPS O-acetylase OafA/YrhL